MPSKARTFWPWAAALVLGILAWTLWPQWHTEPDTASPAKAPTDTTTVARGAYLARMGNCALCHTAKGGPAYAGGLGIETPFGTVFSSNISPDPQHGIGRWSAQEFWRAMHHGQSRDGRWLTPAFPYTNFTHISRSDTDALYAYLMAQAPSDSPNTPHTLRWPYNTQIALGVWRALFFKPGTPEAGTELAANPAQRGRYLVEGLGHCDACHTQRNLMGASDTSRTLAGGMLPMQDWYAPSLRDAQDTSLSRWSEAELRTLLQTGTSARGNALGPMAEVVLHSTQYLSDADAQAVASYLKSLPPATTATGATASLKTTSSGASMGAHLYEQHCASCHGKQGEGIPGAYPALAQNATVLSSRINNLVQVVWRGGFAPATAANPRPFGMPPFLLQLNEQEMAALLSYVRSAWGNDAAAVSEFDINKLRTAQPR